MSSLIPSRELALRISALALAISLAACGGGGGESQQMPPQGVSVAAVVQQSISPSREFTGRIQAVDAVELRPRVAGYLAKVHVREGALVAKDALLFSIDDREYRAAVAAAEADVARAEARRRLAQTEYDRSEALIASRAVSQGDLDARGVSVRRPRRMWMRRKRACRRRNSIWSSPASRRRLPVELALRWSSRGIWLRRVTPCYPRCFLSIRACRLRGG